MAVGHPGDELRGRSTSTVSRVKARSERREEQKPASGGYRALVARLRSRRSSCSVGTVPDQESTSAVEERLAPDIDVLLQGTPKLGVARAAESDRIADDARAHQGREDDTQRDDPRWRVVLPIETA